MSSGRKTTKQPGRKTKTISLTTLLVVAQLAALAIVPSAAADHADDSLVEKVSVVDALVQEESGELSVEITNPTDSDNILGSKSITDVTFAASDVAFTVPSSPPSGWTAALSSGDLVFTADDGEELQEGDSVTFPVTFDVEATAPSTVTFTVTADETNDAVVGGGESQSSATFDEAVATNPPEVIDVITLDSDGNGFLDGIEITFDEALDNTNFVPSDFTVGSDPISSGSVSGDVVTLDLDEGSAPDTDVTPTVSYSSATPIEDQHGNAWDGTTPTTVDAAPPVVVSATTVDGDGNGRIDSLMLAFSEDLGTSAPSPQDFLVGGVEPTAASVSGSDITLTLTEGVAPDTGATPGVSYSGSDVVDAAGNEWDGTAPATTDGAAPVAVSAITSDQNSNGRIDRIDVTFSEALDATHFEANDFGVAGHTATSVSLSSDTVQIALAESLDPDTAATPSVTYDATGGDDVDPLSDAVGTEWDGGLPTTLDGAKPVMLEFLGVEATDTIYATFSEPVWGDLSASPAGIDVDDLTYINGTGTAQSIQAVTHTADTDSLEATLTSILASGDFGIDALAAASADPDSGIGVYDAANNAADSADQVPLLEVDLRVEEITTGDTTGDGTLDELTIRFNRDIAAPCADAAQWSVEDFTVSGVTTDTTDTDAITLELSSGPAGTGLLPTVAYDPAAGAGCTDPLAWDMNANVHLAAFDATNDDVVDGASPVVTKVRAIEGADFVRVFFSEPVHSTAGGAGLLGSDAFTFSGSQAITAVQHDAGGRWADLILDEDIVSDDLTTSQVAVVADAVFDASGNVAEAQAVDLTDFAGGPTLASAVTLDQDGDGHIDAIDVTFDADLADATPFTSAQAAAFDVAGFNVGSISTGETADDDMLRLHLQEAETPDTDAMPTVGFNDATVALFGADGELILDGSVTAEDGALPILVSASGNPASPLLTLTFSEPVAGSGSGGMACGTGGDLLLTNLVYTDVNGVGARYPQTVESQLDDLPANVAVLRMDADLLLADVDPAGSPDQILIEDDVADCAGHPIVEAVVSLRDIDQPAIEAAQTVDADGDGAIDAIQVTFDEEIDTASLGSSGWDIDSDAHGSLRDVIASGTAANGLTYPAADRAAYVTFAEATMPDSGAVPGIQYDGSGTVADLAGNPLEALSGFLDTADGVAPVPVQAVTADADADGKLDGYHITFSEGIDCATATDAGFVVAGFDLSGAACLDGLASTDDEILLGLAEPADADTAVVPQLSYNGLGDVADTAGNLVAAFDDNSTLFVEADGAGPVLWRVTGDVDGSQAIAWFSEGVDNGAGGPLFTGSFTYTDASASGVDRILSVDHIAGASTATLHLGDASGALDLSAADIGDDQIAVSLEKVFDLSEDELPVPVAPRGFTDLTGPTIEAVTTADSDGDGRIDILALDFNEDLGAIETSDLEDFSVAGHTIDTAMSSSSGDMILLALEVPSEAAPDTDATPQVSYAPTGDAITDDSGNAWDGTVPATVDAAAPAIISAKGTIGEQFIHVTFSEPVFAADDATGALAADDLDYTDGTGTGVAVLDVDHVAGGGALTLTLDGDTLASDDFTAPLAHVAAGSMAIYDAAGNAAGTDTFDLVEVPAIDIDTIRTLDTDQNGHIDALELTFSQSLAAPEGGFGDAHADSFSVAGLDVLSVTAGPEDDALILHLAEGDEPDTGATPDVTYTRDVDAPIAGETGGVVAGFDETDATSYTDSAAPVLVSAHGNPGAAAITLTFSEPVSGSGSSGELLITNLLYNSVNGIGASSIFSVTDSDASDGQAAVTADADLLFADIDAAGTPDAVAAKASVTDGAGNDLIVQAIRIQDADAPSITSVETVDADGDGHLDALLVHTDEAIAEDAIHADGFQIGSGYGAGLTALRGGAASNGVTYTDAGDNAFYLAFAEQTAFDTGATPEVGYTPGDAPVTDLSGNPLEAINDPFTGALVSSDGAAPVLVEAISRDDDGDGQLDRYDLTLSEDIDQSSISNAGWDVAGLPIDMIVDAPGDDGEFTLAFDAIAATGIGDTGAVYDVTYSADAGTLTDLAGNALGPVGSGDLDEEDGASAVLMHVAGQAGDTVVTAVFSEGVDNGATPPLGLTASHFEYTDNAASDVDGIAEVQHEAGDTIAILTLAGDGLTVADFGSDEINVKAYTVFDLSDNPVAVDPVGFRDLGVPNAIGITTDDADEDGFIDALHIQFDEPVDDTNLEVEDFTVSGYTATDAALDISDDSIVILTLCPADDDTAPCMGDVDASPDTGALPAVTYDATQGATTDPITDAADDANPWNGILPATADGAAPQVLGAETTDEGDGILDAITVLHTEPIAGVLAADDFAVPGYTVDSAAAVGSSIVLQISQDVAEPIPDTGATPAVDYAPMEAATDAAGNGLSPYTGLVAADAAAPFLMAAGTADTDFNGLVDEVRLRFSEALDGTNIEAADFASDDDVVLDATLDADTIALDVEETFSFDGMEFRMLNTGSTASFDYDPVAGASLETFSDLAGNDWQQGIDGTFVTAEDTAGPTLLGATVLADGTTLRLQFSEPIYGAFDEIEGTFDALDADDFAFEAGTDGKMVTEVHHLAGTTVVDLVFNTTFTADDVAGGADEDTLHAMMTVYDAAGNKADPANTVHPAFAPYLVSASTVDHDGDGQLDGIKIKFSEPIVDGVDGANLVADHWALWSRDVTITTGSEHLLPNAQDDEFIFVELLGEPVDTSSPLKLAYFGDSIVDADGDELVPFWFEDVADVAAPIVTAIVTQDVDSDGELDSVRVTFSEEVAGTAAGWTLAGEAAGDAELSEDGSAMIFQLASGLDTSEMPGIGYDAEAGDIADLADNPLASFDAVAATDAAAPVLLSVENVDADDDGIIDGITAKFSEDLVGCTETDFSVAGQSDPVATCDGSTVSVTFAEDGGVNTALAPQLVYTSPADDSAVADAAGNAWSGSIPATTDVVAPILLDAATAAYGQAGRLERVHVEFSEWVQGGGVASDWTIGGSEPTKVVHLGDMYVSLHLPSDTDLGTGDTPVVTFSGGVADLAGNPAGAADSFPTRDGAAPVLLSASSAGPGKDGVTLRFSEAVKGTGTDGAVTPADLSYQDASGPASGIASVDSNVDGVVKITLDQAVNADDQSDAIRPAGITDLAGNAPPGLFVDLEIDATPPAQVDDLALATDGLSATSAKLTWSPVGDDGGDGAPATYKVYRHTSAITVDNLDDATLVASEDLSFGPAQLLAGDATEAQTVVISGLTKETTYFFAIQAEDESGNVGPLSDDVELTTLADDTAPVGTLTIASSSHNDGTPSQTTDLVFSWNEVTDDESDLDYHYAVNDQASYTVTTDDTKDDSRSVTISGLDDGIHYVHVAAISGGGTTQADAFEVIVDTAAPEAIDDLTADADVLSMVLSWSAPSDAGPADLSGYELRYSTTSFSAGDFDDQTLATGLPSPGGDATYALTGLSPDTTYHVAVRARDAAGNEGPVSDVIEVATDPDTTPPVGDLALTSTHTEGVESLVTDVAFSWNSVADAETAVQYRYALSSDADHVLDEDDPTTTDLQVGFDDVAAGTHYFHLAAESAGGRTTQETYEVVIERLTEEQLEDANLDIETKVTRDGDSNVITWTLPDETPADVAGVQILRSNSPYRVIATVDSGSSEFQEGRFVDDSDDALEDSKYLVTMYYGADVGKYDSGEEVDIAQSLDSSAASLASTGSGFFASPAFYIGLLAMMASIVIMVVAVVRHQGRNDTAEVQE